MHKLCVEQTEAVLFAQDAFNTDTAEDSGFSLDVAFELWSFGLVF